MTYYLNTHYLNFNFQIKRKLFCIFYFSEMKGHVFFSFNLLILFQMLHTEMKLQWQAVNNLRQSRESIFERII